VNSGTFGAGEANLLLGSMIGATTLGTVVAGAGAFLYGNVNFSNSSSLTVTTKTATVRTGGKFSTDLNMGSGILTAATFTLTSGGRIARYDNNAVSNGQLLIGDTSAGYFKAATLTQGNGIVITNAAGGVTVAADPTLATIAGLTTGADKLAYFTGVDTAAVTDFTSAGRNIVATASNGTLGQVLTSSGAGVPTWTALGSLVVSGLDESATPPAVGDLCYIAADGLAALATETQNGVLGVKSAAGTVVTFGPVVVSAHASAAFSAGDEVVAGKDGVVITRAQVSDVLSAGDWIVRVGFALETTTAGADVQILFNRGDAIEIP
jgi:hypothetical protein